MSRTENTDIEQSPSDVSNYSELNNAIVTTSLRIHYAVNAVTIDVFNGAALGVVDGVVDLAEMVAHPIDNFLHPTYLLLNDAATLTSVHTTMLMPPDRVASYAVSYHNSFQRMNERVSTITENFRYTLLDASPAEAARTISKFATTVFGPGAIFRGAKAVQVGARNFEALGVVKNPPLFIDTMYDVDRGIQWSPLTPQQILKTAGEQKYPYVVTQDAQLVIASRKSKSLTINHWCQPRYVMVHHHDLAKLKPVIAAGEVEFVDGVLKRINNESGHYMPSGNHLKPIVEHVFSKRGFDGRGNYANTISSSVRPTPSTPLFSFHPADISPGILALLSTTKPHRLTLPNRSQHNLQQTDLNSPQSNLSDVLTRSTTTQTFNIALTTAYEERICRSALFRIQQPVLQLIRAMNSNPTFSDAFLETEKKLFFELHNVGDETLKTLRHKTTAIGKSTLPRIVNMFEHPSILNMVYDNRYSAAIESFRNIYVREVGISTPILERLKYGSWVFGIASSALIAHQVVTSKTPVREAVHQATLLSGSYVGATTAGQLSLGPCASLGLYAPVCVAAASLLGGIAGAEVTEKVYQHSGMSAHAAALPHRLTPSITLQTSATKTRAIMSRTPDIETLIDNTRFDDVESTLSALRAAKTLDPNNQALASFSEELNEDRVCSGLRESTRVGGNAVVVTTALMAAGKLAPVRRPLLRGLGTSVALQSLWSGVEALTTPAADAVDHACHATFSALRSKSAAPARAAQATATQSRTTHEMSHSAATMSRVPARQAASSTAHAPIQQRVVRHQQPARQPVVAVAATSTSTAAVQFAATDLRYTKFVNKMDELRCQAATTATTLHNTNFQEKTSREKCAEHLGTLSATMGDAALIAGVLGKSALAERLSGAATGLQRLSYGIETGNPVSCIAGVMVFGKSLFGKSKKHNGGGDNALAAIFAAIAVEFAHIRQTLHQIVETLNHIGQMVEQIQRTQELMFGTLQVTLHSILAVDARLIQQHGENQAKLDDILKHPLAEACLTIEDYLNETNSVILSSEKIGENLNTIKHWLEKYFQSSAMNASASGPTSSSQLSVQFLVKHRQSPLNVIGYVMVQLQALLGDRFPEKYFTLPSHDFIKIAQLLFAGVEKAKLRSGDAWKSTFDKLEEIIETYADLINFFRTHSEIWTALFNQYEHYRDMVGRAIYAAEVPNSEESLDTLVTNDAKRMILDNALYQMEEKRLLLLVLLNIVNGNLGGDLHDRIHALKSRAQILEFKGSELVKQRDPVAFYTAITAKKSDELTLVLRAGGDLNSAYPDDGNAARRTAQPKVVKIAMGHFPVQVTYPNNSVEIVHGCLGHCSPDATQRMNAFYPIPGREYAPGNALNRIAHLYHIQNKQPKSSQFIVDFTHQLLSHNSSLQTIKMDMKASIPSNGFDGWSEHNSPIDVFLKGGQYAVPLLLIAAGFEGQLNEERVDHHKLRIAYRYYQSVTQGELAIADSRAAARDKVDPYYLSLLVAILGDWTVFEGLKCAAPDLTITVGNYTPLMFAAELGRADVVVKLIELIRKDNPHEMNGINNALPLGRSAATLAFEQGHFEIARYLNEKGAPLSAEHIARLIELAPGALAISQRPEVIALGAINPDVKTQHETALTDLQTLISASRVKFAKIPPRANVVAPAAAETSDANDIDDDCETVDGEEGLFREELAQCGRADLEVKRIHGDHGKRFISTSNFRTPLDKARFFKALKKEKPGVAYQNDANGAEEIVVHLETKKVFRPREF